MLKRFFVTVLGTMAGLWISIALLFVFGIFFVAALAGKMMNDSSSKVKVDKNSILHIELSGDVQERDQPASFIQLIQQVENNAPTLKDMITSIRLAADDDNINGIYLDCGGASMGAASREELCDALASFKSTGKWIVAYADAYTQSDYLNASFANELFLNPMGAVDIHGLGGQTPFFKNLLDKVGVKMQIIKVGTFKSAVEPYILDKMSEPARLQMQQYCDSIWDYMANVIADNCDLEENEVKELASEMLFTKKAEFFIENDLVTDLKYRRQVEDYLRELVNCDKDSDLPLISCADYVADKYSEYSSRKKHIAVYYAVGEIVDAGDEGIVGKKVVDDIVGLADDENVSGMVLRVNSPGGSAFASEQIWDAIGYFKSQGKPVYVSMGDYAASGGYYISCGADSIFADRTTITGSIGVFGMIPDCSGLITDKLGVNFSVVETNPNATGISLVEPMTPAQYEAMQKSVENIYDLFTSRVAEGRSMSQAAVKEIAEGRVWVGSKAVDLGLVDGLANLEMVISMMEEKVNLPAEAYVSYPVTKEKIWEQFLRKSGGLDVEVLRNLDKETVEQLYYIKRIREASPIQARMEPVTLK